jgi:DNA mismatch endonuclease, patch repair protein
MTWPRNNAAWWRAKITRNQIRDVDTDARLCAAGWAVVRLWEHEDLMLAAARIAMAVRGRVTR